MVGRSVLFPLYPSTSVEVRHVRPHFCPQASKIAHFASSLFFCTTRETRAPKKIGTIHVKQEGAAQILPSAATSFPSIEKQLEIFKQERLCTSSEEDLVTITWDKNKPYESLSLSSWVLYVSANPENGGQILASIQKTLFELKAPFQCVKNEAILQKRNEFSDPIRGKFREGKCVIIYPASEEQALALASKLHVDLSQSKINSSQPAINRTARPIGSSGHLWAKHSLAGTIRWNTHSTEDMLAEEGNYLITYSPRAESLKQEDIFEKQWGCITWSPTLRQFIQNSESPSQP